MELSINLWAVLVAAIANFVIGALWYGPLFGKTWARLMGFGQEQMQKMKEKNMVGPMILNLIALLIMGVVLSSIIALKGVGVSVGLHVGFWIWLGFLATSLLNGILWEGKPAKLYFLNALYWLVIVLVAGAIIGGWQ